VSLLNICQINIVALSFPIRVRARIKNVHLEMEMYQMVKVFIQFLT